MKKFISLLLALIIASTVSLVAFAEPAYFCPTCQTVFNTEEQYNNHNNTGCLEQYDKCPYCDATVKRTDLKEHVRDCPKGAGNCKYCGEAYATQGDYELHIATDCWLVGLVGKDVADVIIKIVDFLKNVDWEGLFGKISDAVSGIDLGGVIDTIKPVFEKIIGFVGEKVQLPA